MANIEVSVFKNLNTLSDDMVAGDNPVLFSRLGSTNLPTVPTVEIYDSSGNMLGWNYTLNAGVSVTVNNPTGATVNGVQTRIY